jgi:hypothetical protein
MIEINRCLYMDEISGEESAGFSEIRDLVGGVVGKTIKSVAAEQLSVSA